MWDLFFFLIIIMYKERAEGETKQDKLQILLPPNQVNDLFPFYLL